VCVCVHACVGTDLFNLPFLILMVRYPAIAELSFRVSWGECTCVQIIQHVHVPVSDIMQSYASCILV